MTQTYEASKVIENTEKIKQTIRTFLTRCDDPDLSDKLELALEDEYLSFDLVKELKEKWNASVKDNGKICQSVSWLLFPALMLSPFSRGEALHSRAHPKWQTLFAKLRAREAGR